MHHYYGAMRKRISLEQLKTEGILDIRAGYPFRGRIFEKTHGAARVVQIRNADPDRGVDWGSLIRTDLTGRGEPDWLQSGDILFVARGGRNFAVSLKDVPEKTVCLPHFFRIRINPEPPKVPEHELLPAFLAWQMNQRPAQRHFKQSAEGTLQRSVRRGELEVLNVVIPKIDKQRAIVKLIEQVNAEKQLLNDLISNTEKMAEAIANDVLDSEYEGKNEGASR